MKTIQRSQDDNTNRIYQSETYDLKYQNFTFSNGYSFDLSTYIINNSTYSLKCGASLFFDKRKEKKRKEELTYTLVDIGNGDVIENQHPESSFNSENVGLGYYKTVNFGTTDKTKKGFGCSFNLIVSEKLRFFLKSSG